MIRVLIADDQALIRTGFRLLLDLEDDIAIVGEAANGEDAVRLAGDLRPDVILMDIRMPLLDGIAATRRVLATGAPVRVLVLTTFDLDEYVYDALEAGASGFLLKDVTEEQLVTGIRTVHAGEAVLAPTITRRLISEFVTRARRRSVRPPGLDDLTARELEVFTMLGKAMSNAEIAEALVLGEATVKTHVARVLDKLGLRDRVQAVVAAYEAGVVEPDGRS